jgi:cobalt-zinc-cadmium efflux system membrane fusion protein
VSPRALVQGGAKAAFINLTAAILRAQSPQLRDGPGEIKRMIIGKRCIGVLIVLLLAITGVACSTDAKPAVSRNEINLDPDVFAPEHPELFKLAKAETRVLPTILAANGSVTPDVNRTIHVTSLGAGRAVDLRVRLGDSVKKGQVLLVISSPDLASASSDFQKARSDDKLARGELERTQLLYAHGALAEKDLQLAQDTADKAKVDLQTSEERIRQLGGDPASPGSLIQLRSPVTGTIVEQNVAGFEGVKSLDNTPNLFTIADLSQVWVVCDVYENDLGNVHAGDSAEIRLNADPGRVYEGKISDIARVLDPATRSAKVRIVLANGDASLRPGMYAVATFRSRKPQPWVVVPGTAIMRLQDKDWVFRQDPGGRFRRLEVHAAAQTPDGLQEIQTGLNPGDEVIANALEFSSAVAGQGK